MPKTYFKSSLFTEQSLPEIIPETSSLFWATKFLPTLTTKGWEKIKGQNNLTHIKRDVYNWLFWQEAKKSPDMYAVQAELKDWSKASRTK